MHTFAVFGLGQLGSYLCVELLRQGNVVLGFDRDPVVVDALKHKLKEYDYSRGVFHVIDFTNSSQIDSITRPLFLKYEPEFFVNSFGEVQPRKYLWEIRSDDFKQMVDNNLVALFNTCKVIGEYLSSRKSGIVVNCTSKLGRHPAREFSSYCASLFGEEGLSKSFAADLHEYGCRCYLLDTGRIAGDQLDRLGIASTSQLLLPEDWAKLAINVILALPHLPDDSNGKDIDLQSNHVKRGERTVLAGLLLAKM
ncbi:hypothetical protein P9112_013768 [Eukaryota sp. TZLM1-RC]